MNWCIAFLASMLRALILSMIVVLTIFGFMMTASTWTGILFPVAHIEITGGEWDGDDYVMSGFLDKYRSCEYLGMTWRDQSDGLEYTVKTPRRPPNQTVSRPAEDGQLFENWRMINAPKTGGEFKVYTHHRCHELWDTFSTAGAVIIPGKGEHQ